MLKKKKKSNLTYTYYNPNKPEETRKLLKKLIVKMLIKNK